MVYVIYVNIPFGVDDTLYCEYTGVQHTNINDAEVEKEKADKDENVIYSKIECWNDQNYTSI